MPQSIKPKVSVLIPTYNQAALVVEAVESVMAQTFQDFELIIVDNHSTDGTEAALEPYLQDPRVLYHRNNAVLPMYQNWNRCLDFAKGELIKYLCSDDKFHPELLAHFVPIMDQYPRVAVVSCEREWFGDSRRYFEMLFPGLHDGQETIVNTLRHYNWLAESTCVMFRRKNLHAGLFRNYTWITDWEMWVRQLGTGDYYGIPKVLAYCRVHKDQVTKRDAKKMIRLKEDYELAANIRDRKYPIDFSGYASELDRLVRARALTCARQMYRHLSLFYTKESRKFVRTMYRIAASEKVVLASVMEFIKRHATGQKPKRMVIGSVLPNSMPAENNNYTLS